MKSFVIYFHIWWDSDFW